MSLMPLPSSLLLLFLLPSLVGPLLRLLDFAERAFVPCHVLVQRPEYIENDANRNLNPRHPSSLPTPPELASFRGFPPRVFGRRHFYGRTYRCGTATRVACRRHAAGGWRLSALLLALRPAGRALGSQPLSEPGALLHKRRLLPKREVAPNFAQQLLLGEDPLRLRRELRKQVVLLRGQRQRPAVNADAACDEVDGDRPRLEAVPQRRRRPSKDRTDPRQQLVIVKRSRHVVVAASVEGTHPIHGVGSRSPEHDNGDLPVPEAPRLALAEPPAELW